MKTWTIAVIAFSLAACASAAPETAGTPVQPTPQAQVAAPAAAVGVDPVGNYEFSTVVDGQTVTGTMTIAGTKGAYTGRVITNLFPEMPVVGASAEGNKMTVRLNMPDGEVTLNLTFEGANFTGNWQVAGDTGDITGKKLAK